MAFSPTPDDQGRVSRALRPKRPWYLSTALALAWLLGAVTILMSSVTLSIFHLTPDEFNLEVDGKPDLTAEDRTRQKETYEAYVEALRAARNRVVPLAVGELVIGAAMIVFAQRAAVGRSWARHALVQLTLAHAALAGLEWSLTASLRAPENAFELAYNNLDPRATSESAAALFRLGMGLTVSAITVIGLSVRGSRAFYAGLPTGERRPT